MIFWNTIIQRKENAVLKMSKLRPIYPFTVTDQESLLQARDFNVTVAWHVMPKVGALYTGSRTFSGFTMPEEYFDMQKDVIRPAGGSTSAKEKQI
jgi:Signal peptidase subunit